MKKQIDQVDSLIKELTNDEDIRQQLWIEYLSGCSLDELGQRLMQIKMRLHQDRILQDKIRTVYRLCTAREFSEFLDNFTETERRVIFYIMLGIPMAEIVETEKISEIRIRQVMTAIMYNPVLEYWRQSHGSKEETDRRREIRPLGRGDSGGHEVAEKA